VLVAQTVIRNEPGIGADTPAGCLETCELSLQEKA